MKKGILIVAACLTAGAAHAQMVSVGPFTGQESDGFETQLSGSFDPCVVGRVFNDNADLCASSAHITGGWSSSSCQIGPNSGSRLFGATSGGAKIAFDAPVRRFGAYFGNNNVQNVVTANFYDASGAQIGSAPVSVNADCLWVWNGWESQGAPIALIELQPDTGRVMLEDMEADFDGAVGTRYCLSVVNSSGTGAVLYVSGSASVAANSVVLAAEPVPASGFGVFFYGEAQLQLPYGDGFLCVGPGSSYLARLPVVQADSLGRMQDDLDNTAPIHAVTEIQAGSTWHFQAWFQDPAAGGAGYNFSDAVSVTFQP